MGRHVSVLAKQGGQLGQVAMFGAVSVTTTLLDFGLFNLLCVLAITTGVYPRRSSDGASTA